MMLNYSFFKEEKKRPFFLKINFQPELTVLSSYLFQVTDLQTYKWILEGINDVLSGKSNYVERDTEWYGANITSQDTTVYVLVDENNENTDVIDTGDFKTVLQAWWNEKESFDRRKCQ